MKFFHISDLHIGLKLENKDLSEDQRYILNEIVREAELKRPDALVIAGDIYDKSLPSNDAIEIFDEFILKLSKAVPKMNIMIISGNHDSAVRINQFRKLLSRNNIYLIGQPPRTVDEFIEKIEFNDEFGKINFYLLPFVKPSYVRNTLGLAENENSLSYDETLHRLIEREDIDKNDRNVLVSHQYYVPVNKNPEEVDRMESEIISIGNIDMVRADILEYFDYSALGHIHKPWKVMGECHRYSGTPLACSVSEAGQEKGIVMVEMFEKGRINTEVIPLKSLRKIRVVKGSITEVLQEGSKDYVKIIVVGEHVSDIDLADRIRDKFPNYLEICRENFSKGDANRVAESSDELSEIENCRLFLKELSAEEEVLLASFINELKERLVNEA
ncbi:MAG: exonuclease SbcCD subunit D [Catonella sp.]|uniref:exonuclease SbcCD subunit D n=1 Tax=Catonella sp. TaxID=2382125 RepID=UPI003FA098B1